MTLVSAITLNTEVRTQKLVTLHGRVDIRDFKNPRRQRQRKRRLKT